MKPKSEGCRASRARERAWWPMPKPVSGQVVSERNARPKRGWPKVARLSPLSDVEVGADGHVGRRGEIGERARSRELGIVSAPWPTPRPVSGKAVSEGEARHKRGWLKAVRSSPLSDAEASKRARTPTAGQFAPQPVVLAGDDFCRR